MSQHALHVISWNIYMLPANIGNTNLSRSEVIADQLIEKDADIVVLQEVFHHKSRHRIERKLLKKYPYQSVVANHHKISIKANSGVIIFSKYPILKYQEMKFQNKSGIDAFSRKGAILIDINYHNQIVQIIGTHLQNSENDQIKFQQCQELRKFIDLNKRCDLQILCGDFNINKDDTSAYLKMIQILNNNDGELYGELKYSYDRVDNDFKTENGDKKELIDYILISDSKISAFRQILQMKTRWCENHLNLSDHYAIQAIFKLN